MACAISASMLGRRPAVKLGAGLRPSLAATDWKAVTEMLCDLFLGSCMHSGLKSSRHNGYEDSQRPCCTTGSCTDFTTVCSISLSNIALGKLVNDKHDK